MLVAAFWRAEPVPAQALGETLGEHLVEALVRDGVLVREAGGRVRADAALQWLDDAWVWVDPPGPRGDDAVPPVSAVTRGLAALVPRHEVGTLRDLGTGSGAQALRGALHAGAVTGVDINRRALAGRGAQTNAAEHVEWLEGSWFGPVDGRRFDLVCANPPYVISPDSGLLYRDSGWDDDGGVCGHIARELPRHLADDGIAVMLAEWPRRHDGHWADLPRSWLPEDGCDAVVIRLSSSTPEEHAALWIGDIGTAPEDAAALCDRWLAHHAAIGCAEVVQGAVVLRRTGGRGLSLLTADAYPEEPAGDHVLRLLEGARRGPARDRIAAECVRPCDGLTVSRFLGRPDGRARIASSTGLQLSVVVHQATAAVLDAASPSPVRDVLGEVAPTVTGDEEVARVLRDLDRVVRLGLAEAAEPQRP